MHINQYLIEQFHNIKYVCMQGSGYRAQELAQKLGQEFLNIDPNCFQPVNLFQGTRFECYKIDNILSVSHGMGAISISTLLHNLTKILHFAKNEHTEYIRIGTCGGININPGSIIITDTVYTPNLKTEYSLETLGKDITYPTYMNKELNDRILNTLPKNLTFDIYRGNTISADDFYLGQARFDGAIKPTYDETKREQYFDQIKQLNIYNMEMEGAALAAFCNRADIPATMIAVTLLDRIKSDQVTASNEELKEYSDRVLRIVINYLKSAK